MLHSLSLPCRAKGVRVFCRLKYSSRTIVCVKQQTSIEGKKNSWIATETTDGFQLDDTTNNINGGINARLQEHSIKALVLKLVKPLLPKDHSTSVGQNYVSYISWTAVGTIACTTSSVIATQAMLIAMGTGANSFVAATSSWIIKDGLAMLAGLLFPQLIDSCVNIRFDADPKRWRFISAVARDASSVLGVLTPVAPQLFVPIAGLANGIKAISALTSSASRAAINKSFTRCENLGDVTAKSSSQSIAAKLVGTGFGVFLISQFAGSTSSGLAAVLGLTGIHLFCYYRGLQQVVLPTLNIERAWVALRADLKRVAHKWDCDNPSKFRAVRTPVEVAEKEGVFLPPQGGLRNVVVGPDFASFVDVGIEPLDLSPPEPLERTLKSDTEHPLKSDTYWVRVLSDGRVGVLFEENATTGKILEGFAHAALVVESIRAGSQSKDGAVDAARVRLMNMTKNNSVRKALDAKGWDTKQLFLETQNARIQITSFCSRDSK